MSRRGGAREDEAGLGGTRGERGRGLGGVRLPEPFLAPRASANPAGSGGYPGPS